MKSALLVVDVQNDFADPKGSLYVPGGEEVAAQIVNHLQYNDYDYVIMSKDWHIEPHEHFASFMSDEPPDYVNTWPDHCRAITWGSNFYPGLPTPSAVFLKGEYQASYSAFDGVDFMTNLKLDEWLKENEVGHLAICGLALDYCVWATTVDACDRKYTVTLLPDLTRSINADKAKVLADLQKATNCLIYLGQ